MTTTAALVLAGLCCCGGAALAALIIPRHWTRIRTWPYLLLAGAAILLAVAGFRADVGDGGSLQLGTVVGFGSSALRIDPLGGLFLALTGVIAAPIMVGFSAWSVRDEDVPSRTLGATTALTIAGVVVVLLADNAYVFLFGWESVSLAFYLLSGYRRDLPGRPFAGMLSYGFSKSSGAFLLVGFLLLAGATGSFHLADWSTVTGAAHDGAYALLLVGFATKVGVVPLQVWMPTGYAAAPGPARALMSAVAANIGFYGMWRTLAILGKPPTWLVVVLLLLAAFTALLGIAHAAVQRDLPRVIAYSSVENGGLITAGYAIGLAGAAAGIPRLIALGLLTSALQMVAHAFAKSSLFLATARLEQTTGERELDRLLGAGRTEPVTGLAFSAGALTLAGMPLTLGFVSEWFLLESIMQLFRLPQLTLQITFALAGAAVALAAGFAGFTFVRLVGMTILGGHRPRPGTTSARPGIGWTVAMVLPAAGCVAVAAVSPWEVRFLARGLAPVVPTASTLGGLKSPWVLQPVFTDFSALSPSWLAVEIPILAALVLGFAVLASGASMFRVRRVPAWRSATGGVAGGDARYTPFAFANPTRHVLGNLLLTRARHTELDEETRAETQATSIFTGPDMPAAEARLTPSASTESPGATGTASASHATTQQDDAPQAAYSTDVIELVETFVYRPALVPLRRVVAAAKRLQSGRLDAYITYMLIALVGLIAVVVAVS